MNDSSAILEQIPSLRRYARALVGGRDEADDLVQDCVERAWSRWHLYQPDRALRPWLFAIMHNLFISERRRSGRSARIVWEPGLHETVSSPAQEPAVILADVAKAMERLPTEQREVLLLVGLEGLSYAEAATATGVPVGTVMSRLFRARERLRMLLDGQEMPALRRVK